MLACLAFGTPGHRELLFIYIFSSDFAASSRNWSSQTKLLHQNLGSLIPKIQYFTLSMLIIILFIKIAVKSGIPIEQNPDNKNASNKIPTHIPSFEPRKIPRLSPHCMNTWWLINSYCDVDKTNQPQPALASPGGRGDHATRQRPPTMTYLGSRHGSGVVQALCVGAGPDSPEHARQYLHFLLPPVGRGRVLPGVCHRVRSLSTSSDPIDLFHGWLGCTQSSPLFHCVARPSVSP